MDPITALKIGGLGIGLTRSLFGGRPTVKIPRIDPFRFDPNENDPELALMRRRALLDQQVSRGRTVDELSRAGLLGSSAAYGVLGINEAQGARTQEDIANEVFSKQRLQALQLYRDNAQFLREKAMAEAGYEAQESQAGLGALEDLGMSLISDTKKDGTEDTEDYAQYLRRRRALLPEEDLWDASNYPYSPPSRRGVL